MKLGVRAFIIDENLAKPNAMLLRIGHVGGNDMTELITIYKIRMKGSTSYSIGRVSKQNWKKNGYGVTWKAKGKDWPTEAALKKHLLTCIEKGVDISEFEIMEFTQQPSRSLNEWCDAKMTMAKLKYNGPT